MSRRSGQTGCIERKGNFWYARFWLDVPGKAKRVNKAVRICPVVGPGSLNKSALKRRLMEIVAESGANAEITLREAEAVNLGTTFQQQAERWLKDVQIRKRNPIKPRTADAWNCYLKFINSHLGEVPLSDVNNKTVKDFIATMASAQKKDKPRFSAKSIGNYVQVIKMVVASVMDENGDVLYPRKWNHDFMDLPVVGDQRTPTFAADEVTSICAKAEGQYAELYALLAGSGLRIEEAFALQVEDVMDNVICVRHSLWRGKLYSPKTEAGIREVDLHSSLAARLRAHLGSRKSGFVFQTSRGTPFARSNVLRRSLHTILAGMKLEKRGFHAFRRFRVSYLRKLKVPEDLIRYWIGHADGSVTDGYSKLKEDVEFRRFTTEQTALGFVLPPLVAPCCTQSDQVEIAVAA